MSKYSTQAQHRQRALAWLLYCIRGASANLYSCMCRSPHTKENAARLQRRLQAVHTALSDLADEVVRQLHSIEK